MKTTNYLQLEYQRTLRLFRKLHSRFEKRIANHTIGELTARKRYRLSKKLQKLKDKLSTLVSRIKLAGLAGAMGLAGLTFDAEGQALPTKTKTYDRHLLNDNYADSQRNPSVAMNDNGDIVSVWRDNAYDVRGKKISSDGTETYFDVVAGGDEGFYARSPQVDIDESGDFVVVWEQNQYVFDVGTNVTIQMERFDGETVLGEGTIEVADINDETSNQKLGVALEEDGDAMVTYVDIDDVYGESTVNLTFVESGGSIQNQVLNLDPTRSAGSPSISMDSDGNTIVAWADQSYSPYYGGYYESIAYQKFIAGDVSGDGSAVVVKNGDYFNTYKNPDVDLNDSGDFVIAWFNDDYDNAEAQKFNASGATVGSELQIHNYTVVLEGFPQVAIDDNGSFGVTHREHGGGIYSIFTQRFNKHGDYVDELQSLDASSTTFQASVAVADMNGKGDFVVVWSDNHNANYSTGLDQSGHASYMTVFQSENPGHYVTSERTFANASQGIVDSHVSSNDDGDYVLAWAHQYASTYYVTVQRYTADGKRNGGQINIHSTLNQIYSIDIDLNSEGEFAIAWNDEEGIYKKVYDAADNPESASPYILSGDLSNNSVSISLDETGDFSVVAWSYYSAGYRIKFNVTNSNVEQLQANEYTYYAGNPDVAIGIDQTFTLVWEDDAYPDGLGSSSYPSIYYRRYQAATPLDAGQVRAADEANGVYGYEYPQVAASHESGDFVIAYSDKYGPEVVGFNQSGDEILSAFHPDAADYYDLDNPIQLDMNSRGDFVVGWEGQGPGRSNYGTMIGKFDIQGAEILPEIMAFDDIYVPSGIAIGNGKAIVTGNASTESIYSVIADPPEFEFEQSYESLVNTETVNSQANSDIAANADGDFVIVWRSGAYGDLSIRAQVYNSDGSEFGNEIVVSDPLETNVSEPHVAMNDDGDIMVVWDVGGGDYDRLAGQVMRKDGGLIADDFDISATTITENLQAYDIAVDNSGDFVVIWSEFYYFGYYDEGSNVYYRRFDDVDGSPLDGNTFLFTTEPLDGEEIRQMVIEQNDDGNFAIAFHTDGQYYYNDESLRVKSFDSGFVEDFSGSVLLGNSSTGDGGVNDPLSVTTDDATGDFIIAHYIYGDDQVLMSRFTPGEASVDPAICVAMGDRPGVTKADNGDFVVVYQRNANGTNVYTQRIDSNFEKVGGELKLNDIDIDSSYPTVTTLGTGVFASSWTAYLLDGSSNAIAKKLFYSFKPAMDILQSPLAIDEGTSGVVGFNDTYVVNNSSLEPVTFDLTSYPVNGELQVSGGTVAPLASLSAADFEILTYVHDGSETTADTFDYVLSNGTFDSETFTMDLVVNPINDIPELDANNGMDISEGGTQSFYEALYVDDPDNPDSELEFEIVSLPAHGTLWNVSGAEVQLGIGDSFFASDVHSSADIEYRHNGDEETSDSFEFTFGDLDFTSTTQTFDITVSPVNDDPELSTNVDLAVNEGETVTITSATLEATDPDHDPADIIYVVNTVDDLPTLGEIRLDGVAVGTDDVFTQADIDNNLVTYVHDGTEGGTSDGFTFDIRDSSEGGATGFTLNVNITLTNDSPSVLNLIPDQVATEDVAFSFALAADTFGDEESSELTITAVEVDETTLPAWLSFDGATFTGTPADGDGDVSISVVAEDEGGLTTFDEFTISVISENDTPTVSAPMSDQSATEDEVFSFSVPAGTFSDEETTTLILTATQSDDSPLPSWLSFDGTTFSGTAAHGDGDVDVKVTATDEGGLTVSDEFSITVTPVNDAPEINAGLQPQAATEDEAFSYSVPVDAFVDEESVTLTLTADLADGNPLPAWLMFDGTTFSGTPDHGDGDIEVRVTATDEGGESTSDTFSLSITQVNDIPVLVGSLSDQTATEDQPFEFTLPVGLFEDEETESLTINVMLTFGEDLPAWLSFDGSTFSGTPPHGAETIVILVVAEDGDGGSFETSFTLTVNQINEAPTVVGSIVDQAATEDEEFSVSIPKSLFEDEETTVFDLDVSVTLADDSALPSWLMYRSEALSGTPEHGDESVTIKVTATDEGGLTTSLQFPLEVVQINDEPVVDAVIPDEAVVGYDPFSFSIPSNLFSDEEEDALSYSASLEDDSPLPAFINFDADNLEFSGEASINVDEGNYIIKVTATENTVEAHTVSTTFEFSVLAVLGLDDWSNEVKVYPNPATQSLNARINTENLGSHDVALVDTQGRVVRRDRFEKNTMSYEYTMSMDGLDTGIYLLRISSKGQVYTFRIQKD